MRDKLHKLQAQLCPVPTKALWGIGPNKSSKSYIHRSIDRITLLTNYAIGYEHKVLLTDVKI